jgi:hypothetical protein
LATSDVPTSTDVEDVPTSKVFVIVGVELVLVDKEEPDVIVTVDF